MKEKKRLNLLNAAFLSQQVSEITDLKLASRVCPGVIPKSEYAYILCIDDDDLVTKTKHIKVHMNHICIEMLTHYHIS